MTDKFKKGYIQIYTGDGKGKTTAALGLALRAAGYGLKTYIAQFMKGQYYGELKSTEDNPYIIIEQFGRDTFLHLDQATPEDINQAQLGLSKAKQALLSNQYDIIILDEINVTLHFNLLTVKQVVELIHLKPPNVELILTGRKAPQQLIDLADLVTEMKEIKHYYQKGVSAREGIER